MRALVSALAAAALAAVCLTAPTASAAPITYQAESAALSGGAAAASDHTGYTGSGFVAGYIDANKGNAATTFAVPTASAGSFSLALRYANGTGAQMTLSLYVDGSFLRQVVLPATTNWDTWGNRLDTVTLAAGNHQIGYRYGTADSGNVNLDSLTVDVVAAPAAGTYEAESATLSGGATVSTEHAGYTGSGFVAGYTDANKGNAATSFSVTMATAGSAPVVLRYANGTGATMTLSLYVGGAKVRQVSLPATGGWATWGTITEVATLASGANTVAFRFDSTDSGNVNLDNITVAKAEEPPPTGTSKLEGSFLSGGVSVATAIAGYDGAGYLTGFTSVGARAIRTVNQTAAGSATATLRYSNGSGSTKTLSVYTNGVKAGQVSLPATSGWSTVQQSLSLRAGLNLIGYQYDSGDSGNVALDELAVSGSEALATRGATLPFTQYEAESGSTNGVAVGPDRTYRTVASESSGRRAVRLDNSGKYVQFTLTKPTNSLVVRATIPDNAGGTGITAPLAIYANGTKVKDLTLSSVYSWVYGNYPFPNDPGLGNGHRFYDDARTTFATTYPAGTVLKVQNDGSTPITVDLVDTEVVAPAYGMPAGALDVTAYGATSGAGDDTAAFRSAISAATAQGKVLWVPVGVFDINAMVDVENVTLRGAGMWHTTIRGINGRGGFMAKGNNVQLADFLFAGDVRYRDPDGQVTTDAALEGRFGTGSLIHNVWVEHSKVGLWVNGGADGLYVAGVRVRNTFADGINFNTQFDGVHSDNAVSNSRVDQSTFRNTGDDALAMWSHTQLVSNSAFTFNSAHLTALANTAAIYGGSSNRIEDNLFADTVYTAAGVTVSTWHGSQAFSGTTVVQRNTLTRTGGWNNDWASAQGGVWIYAEGREITAPVLIKDVDIIDSTYQGVLLTWQKQITNITFDHVTINGTGTYGFEMLSPGNGTFNYVTVSNTTSGGLNNTTGFVLNRGPGNTGF